MAYLRMPETRPDRYVLVTVHSDGLGSISLAGNAVAHVPIDKLPVSYALKHGREVASANAMPLYVSAGDDLWDESWGSLTDILVERD